MSRFQKKINEGEEYQLYFKKNESVYFNVRGEYNVI